MAPTRFPAPDGVAPARLHRAAAPGRAARAIPAVGDAPSTDGAISEAAAAAIEALLDREVAVPEPSEEACRRHYAAHRPKATARASACGSATSCSRSRQASMSCAAQARRGAAGSRALPRPGVATTFAEAARRGPTARAPPRTQARPASLAGFRAADCAPEFAREVFARARSGGRAAPAGAQPLRTPRRRSAGARAGRGHPFEEVRAAVASGLRNQAFVTALRQYLRLLAGAAVLENIDLDSTASPVPR